MRLRLCEPHYELIPMTRNPAQGFCAARYAFPRRGRDQLPARSLAGLCHHRQPLGHNLMTGLTGYWPLCEAKVANGLWFDLHNSNQLSGQINLQVAGNGSTIANDGLNSGSTRLFCSSTSPLQLGTGSITLACWIKLRTSFTFGVAMSKDDGASAREFNLQIQATGTLRLQMGNGTTMVNTTASAAGAIVAGTWYFIAGIHDSVTPLDSVIINAGTAVTSMPVGVGGTSAAQFCLMGNALAAQTQSLDGNMQRAGYWHRALSAGELTYLYNGGWGRDYPFI